ncbi:MAG: Ppx/GppA family phosphatase [Myxococcales bacterium]|nr:Ppx/GppA family phosphatase [Myxococcales bacterium]MCA9571172.1 Ppx/GppA family phosphatase [Myxococcales bacterium]MCB9669980.1 Ppx/GppA family phosphatase [Alphaproteobacteria bacterium]MCB9694344.1 Ppx/GppA family phosphatase [Alphaproteobacteria bacterium]
MRIGAIDVGTNSVHLLVADIHGDGTWDVVEKDRIQVELGAGGLDVHKLSPAAWQRGLDAMKRFAEAARTLDVEDIHCAATSAVREAENGADWCREVRNATGVHVRVIPGREEGRLIYLGARADLDFTRGRVLLMDLGGGSTELISCDSESPVTIESLPLGHIRLTEEFPAPLTKDDLNRLRQRIKAELKPLLNEIKPRSVATLVGTSGTLRLLARMATMARGDRMPEHSHGLVLYRGELDTLVRQLRSTPADQLGSLPGMDPRRQRTITAGAVLVQQVMRAFDKSRLVTSERSLRDGLIVDWILHNRPEIDLLSSVPDPRDRSIQRLMDRFGADPVHAKTVQERSLELFDALAPLHRLGFVERRVLGCAARVHDIGHYIGGASHNKHGAYLIRNSRLHGFTAPEIDLLALVVRYHRGGKPKPEHPEMATLSPDDQQKVRVLAGILRVADGLDRSHSQPVSRIEVELGDGRVLLRAFAVKEAHLERWATERRKDLLESALRQDVRVEVVAERAATTVPGHRR